MKSHLLVITGIIALILLTIACGESATVTPSSPPSTTMPQSTITPKQEAKTGVPSSTSRKGQYLPIKRETIVDEFADDGWTFTQGKDVDGEENYVAVGPLKLADAQLIGPAAHLKEASLVINLSKYNQDKGNAQLMGEYLVRFFRACDEDWNWWVDWNSNKSLLLTKGVNAKNLPNRDLSVIHTNRMLNILLVPDLQILIYTMDPAPAEALMGVVTAANRLNIRDDPGTDEKRIGAVKRGDKLTILGQYNKCAWLLIKSGNLEGWSYGEYIKTNFNCAKTFQSYGEGIKK